MNYFNTKTSLYGVIGNPVKHSKSPLLFNFLFQKYKINAVYLAFENEKIKNLISSMKALNIKGFSITIPHKETAIQYIDEFGKENPNSNEDKIAEKLGCINTIFNDNDRLFGYNFDGYGAVDALIAEEPNYFNKRIAIIGNGGAARGIALSLMLCYNEQPKQLDILCRNVDKAMPLVTDINSLRNKSSEEKLNNKSTNKLSIAIQLKNFAETLPYDIIINTTPIGMLPDVEKSPLDKNQIAKESLIYDIVYTPKMTQLLKIAKKKGAKILTGDNMFLGQAKRQFKIWTGIDLNMQTMREVASELNLFQ